MLEQNPMHMPGALERANKRHALFLRANPSPRESAFRDLLLRCRAAGFVGQFVIERYIIDFAFPDDRLLIELDGCLNPSRDGIARKLVRDRRLVEQGWKVLRIAGSNIAKPRHMVEQLKQLIPHLQIPHSLPAQVRKQRMLLRSPECPAGRDL